MQCSNDQNSSDAQLVIAYAKPTKSKLSRVF